MNETCITNPGPVARSGQQLAIWAQHKRLFGIVQYRCSPEALTRPSSYA
ncbi:hypothetical protein NUH86_23350 (plasmid) [Sphingobium sp. JS3065]|nr:hypothetical protein [Sphingobium sp. JS3065]UZW57937.1 hypothetical protein NUH86_23350 [Sphingobium sp. JS3065]